MVAANVSRNRHVPEDLSDPADAAQGAIDRLLWFCARGSHAASTSARNAQNLVERVKKAVVTSIHTPVTISSEASICVSIAHPKMRHSLQ
jgi:hypothetical protein